MFLRSQGLVERAERLRHALWARPASVGVGSGRLQGASTGLWGGPQRGHEAISSVWVAASSRLLTGADH